MVTTTGKHIDLDLFISSSSYICKCDECNEEISTKYGDPREKVYRFDDKHQVIPSSIRMVCSYCIDELFNHHEPTSIFE
jgi:hypothetical protein